MLNDYGKLWLIALSMILGTAMSTVLILTDNAVAGTGIFGSTVGVAIGYLTGNGVAAARAQAPSPVFVPTEQAIADSHILSELEALDDAT